MTVFARALCLLCLAAGVITVCGLAVAVARAQSPTPDADGAHFSDAAARLHLTSKHQAHHTPHKYLLETMGSGTALFDFDNDGLLDVFFANGAVIPNPSPKGTIPAKGPGDSDRLFHQKKDGTFEDVTEKAGLAGIGYSLGVAVADFDNDGYEDLFVTAYGGNHLYRNLGNGRFADVTVKAGVGGSSIAGQQWSTSAAWVDLDNDGRLDLIVLRYVVWDFDDLWCGEHRDGFRSYCHPDVFPALRPLVYHNNGDGSFTEVGEKIGMGTPGKGLGIALADFDGDGKVDLAVANDSMSQFLYRNKGNGTFDETAMAAEVAVDSDGRTYAGMGVDFGDYDGDGKPDLVITNLANQKYALYRNNGDGSFTYSTYLSGLAHITQLHSGWGIRFFDYDNDGRNDLLVTQGHDLDNIELNYPTLRYREPMLLARNLGAGKFADVSSQAGEIFKQPWVGRGMALGDLDNDGRLDAVVTTNDGEAHLLHNETQTPHHWLGLRLVGHRSNRDAIGAQVRVTTALGTQVATVSTAGSYLSSNDKRLHFGLNNATSAALVEIHWPSGEVQRLQNVAADRYLDVDELEPAKAEQQK